MFSASTIENLDRRKYAALCRQTPTRRRRISFFISRIATPAARKEAAKHPRWDIDDVSLKIRQGLSADEQRRLVDTFFPGQGFALIGQREAGPWQTAEEFFAPFSNRHAIFNHAWALVGRNDLIDDCLTKLDQPEIKILAITGVGRSGKTRIILELLRSYQRKSPDTDISVLSPSEEPDSRSIDDLGRGKRLFVIDNAHDQRSLQLLFQRAAGEPNIKIVLALRGYGFAKVQANAITSGIAGNEFDISKVTPLTISQATCLAAEVLRDYGANEHLAHDIARLTYDCPLATVISSYLVGTRRVPAALVSNEREFRDQILARFRDVVAGQLGRPTDGDLLRKVLKLIALLQPVSPEDHALTKIAKSIKGIEPSETFRAVNILASGGILTKRGRNYRLPPDLLADFTIHEACIGLERRFTGYAESLFSKCSRDQLQNLMVNVSKPDWRLSSTDQASRRLLDGVWGQLETHIEDADSLVDAIANAAYYQPERSLEYAEDLIRKGYVPRELPTLLRNVAYRDFEDRGPHDRIDRSRDFFRSFPRAPRGSPPVKVKGRRCSDYVA
ncbi:hypothetical protein BHUM_01390c [Candidatus Burkholderia humilis]|nr:hypothetical protein BHUM_01390c [Candidatus Burkholderia humilis]